VSIYSGILAQPVYKIPYREKKKGGKGKKKRPDWARNSIFEYYHFYLHMGPKSEKGRGGGGGGEAPVSGCWLSFAADFPRRGKLEKEEKDHNKDSFYDTILSSREGVRGRKRKRKWGALHFRTALFWWMLAERKREGGSGLFSSAYQRTVLWFRLTLKKGLEKGEGEKAVVLLITIYGGGKVSKKKKRLHYSYLSRRGKQGGEKRGKKRRKEEGHEFEIRFSTFNLISAIGGKGAKKGGE